MSKRYPLHTAPESPLSRRGFGGGLLFSPPSEESGEALGLRGGSRLPLSFFLRDVLDVAPDLIGKKLVRRFDDGRVVKYRITETEAYRGEEDKACHANKGRTPRTEVMFGEGGRVYVYFIYGMYWLLNLVTGPENDPSAVLIRGIEGFAGPGRVGRELQLDRSFYGENLITSDRIWLENGDPVPEVKTSKRIGIDYSGEEWVNKMWRFFI